MLKKIRGFLFENQNQKQTLAKNTFWLFFGQISGRTLRAALIIFAARLLGPESWGAFSYVMSLAAFLLILSDIGISAIVTRESAKSPESAAEYFSTAFFLKIFLLSASSLLLIFGAPYLTKIAEARMLLSIVALLLIFDSIRNFGFAISRAVEHMQWEAINEIATNIFIVTLGIYALLKSPSSESLTYAYIAGTGAGMLMMIYTLRHYISKIFTHFNYSLIKPILSASLPFAFASFLGAIMINTDLIMLGWMRTPVEIGYYSAAQKPILFLYTMAGLFAASLFPVLSKLSHSDHKERFRRILEKSIVASLFTALPALLIGLPLSGAIIKLLFGQDYLPAVGSFQVLLLTLPVIFPSVIVSNSLLAINQQKKFIRFSLIGAIGNILFNFLLIPVLGIVGCSVSTLITQILANIFIWEKMDETVHFTVADKLGKILLASLISSALAIGLQFSGSPIILTLAVSMTAYLSAANLFKEETLNQIRSIL